MIFAAMIITIDGPAGTGKSSVSHQVAQQLGFDFLDTGAMYRAIALAALRGKTPLYDSAALAALARLTHLDFDWSAHPPELLLDGQSVGPLLRCNETTEASSVIATVAAVRDELVRRQREFGRERANLVSEGRDQGTVVFPDAELKFYLDATPQERARRRARQSGMDEATILAEILSRDARDSGRRAGPLKAAMDARRLDTTDLTEAQVIDAIVAAARQLTGARA
jgi:cytidylate kinase